MVEAAGVEYAPEHPVFASKRHRNGLKTSKADPRTALFPLLPKWERDTIA
jgi:hypothetical protein